MLYIAVDPGKTNGVAFYNANTKAKIHALQFDTTAHNKPHADFLTLLNSYKPTQIVYEGFYFRQGKTGADYTPVEYISIIRLYAEQTDCGVAAINSSVKTFWDDKKIKALGLWIPGQGHAMDATRILLAHLFIVDQDFKEETLKTLKEKL